MKHKFSNLRQLDTEINATSTELLLNMINGFFLEPPHSKTVVLNFYSQLKNRQKFRAKNVFNEFFGLPWPNHYEEDIENLGGRRGAILYNNGVNPID